MYFINPLTFLLMEKFLSLYVTDTDKDQGYRLVPVKGISSVVQASATSTVIGYSDFSATSTITTGDSVANVTYQHKITITHGAIGADTTVFRDFIQDSIEHALQLSWQHPVYKPNGSGYPNGDGSSVPVKITAIVESFA